MNIAVRYYTRSGNTEILARVIEDAVGAKAEPVTVPLAEKADILFLGCSYYAFDVDEAVKSFLFDNKDNIGTVVCFGTSAMMKSTRKPIKRITDAAGPDARQESHNTGKQHRWLQRRRHRWQR